MTARDRLRTADPRWRPASSYALATPALRWRGLWCRLARWGRNTRGLLIGLVPLLAAYVVYRVAGVCVLTWCLVPAGLFSRAQPAPAPTAAPVVAVQAANEREAWALDVARALGNEAPSRDMQLALIAWQQAEGGDAAFNPFNTTQPWPGSTCYNEVCVRNYASREDGIAATVQTIRYSAAGYQDIREGILTNDPDRLFRGLEPGAWGTNAALARQIYERIRQ